ncbi:MAG TPA: hypothetical protein DIW31_10430 [Bacteroidales bacterium]|nr:hypothetical protein [Bacteroidales bacterium]
MKNNNCFSIMRDKSFYFMTNEDSSIYQYSFDEIESIPGIYFFANLFEKYHVYAKDLKKSMIKNELLNRSFVLKKNFLKEINIAVPDDIQPIEKRFLEEFFFIAIKNSVKVKFTFENMLVTTEDKEYICLYKTCRMLVVSYISNKQIKAKLLLERKDYTEAELKEFIDNIHYDVRGKRLKVYLIGYKMGECPSIGQVVEYEQILRNFAQTTTGA